MQVPETTQRVVLTGTQLLLLSYLGWLTFLFSASSQASGWLLKSGSALWILTFPVILMLAGQAQARQGKKIFAWGYSVLLVSLLAAALSCSYFVFHNRLTPEFAAVAANHSPTGTTVSSQIYQLAILAKKQAQQSIATSGLLYGLGVSCFVAVVAVAAVRNRLMGAGNKSGLSSVAEVLLTCLLFTIGAVGQVYYCQLRQQLAESIYQSDFYKYQKTH